ncbi:DUF6705 family protein [Flavobacterium sp. '19STA2R22 D10 B1']|uniref:DUF6705 family protein n=1 Tax=Flavobacterium aerium TaxID=3037261 RepID=UPI00278C75BC|nr:DUF6705 family protein [Flavobacterium sp. '19STA2R22 D10 B1']
MKKYIGFLIIVFLSSCAIHGQEKVIIFKKGELLEFKKGNYYRAPDEIEKGKPFEGVWEYKNGNENLAIKIELKKTFFPKMGFYIDAYQLNYFYNKGDNNIITNSTIENNNKTGNILETDLRKMRFSSYDMIKKRNIYITLDLLDNNKIKIELANFEDNTSSNKTKRDLTFSIPTGIILTKQNSSKATE